MGFHVGNRGGLNAIYGGAGSITGPRNNGDATTGTLADYYTLSSIDSNRWNDGAISPDGLHLITAPWQGTRSMHHFETDTPFDFEGLTADRITPSAGGFAYNAALDVSDDGTRMWSGGFSSDIYQINLNPTKPFDVTDMVTSTGIDRNSFPGDAGNTQTLLSMVWGRDKRTFLMTLNEGAFDHNIYWVKTDTDYDLSSSANLSGGAKAVIDFPTNFYAQGLCFNYDGTQIFVGGAGTADWATPGVVTVYDLTTPYDVTTCERVGTPLTLSAISDLGNCGGLDYAWDGTHHILVAFASNTGRIGIYKWLPS